MTDKTMREKTDVTAIEGIIADALSGKICGSAECTEFKGSCSLCNARTVLRIPEIEEGQELLEKAKSGKLATLAEPQHLPQKVDGSEYDLNLDQIAIVKQMWRDGWRRTERGE